MSDAHGLADQGHAHLGLDGGHGEDLFDLPPGALKLGSRGLLQALAQFHKLVLQRLEGIAHQPRPLDQAARRRVARRDALRRADPFQSRLPGAEITAQHAHQVVRLNPEFAHRLDPGFIGSSHVR